MGVLCNNASLPDEKSGTGEEEGREILLSWRFSRRVQAQNETAGSAQGKPEVREVAFDADTMMMATYHQVDNGVEIAVKGRRAVCWKPVPRMVEGETDGVGPLKTNRGTNGSNVRKTWPPKGCGCWPLQMDLRIIKRKSL